MVWLTMAPFIPIEGVRSAAPRRRATRIALHARSVAHQREVAALAAHFAFVAFCLGFGAALGLARDRGLRRAGLAPLQGFELLRWREIVLGFLLQRDRAFLGVGDAGARAVAGDRGDVARAAGVGIAGRRAH